MSSDAQKPWTRLRVASSHLALSLFVLLVLAPNGDGFRVFKATRNYPKLPKDNGLFSKVDMCVADNCAHLTGLPFYLCLLQCRQSESQGPRGPPVASFRRQVDDTLSCIEANCAEKPEHEFHACIIENCIRAHDLADDILQKRKRGSPAADGHERERDRTPFPPVGDTAAKTLSKKRTWVDDPCVQHYCPNEDDFDCYLQVNHLCRKR